MSDRIPEVGDKVHHLNRRHPVKAGWLQANGVITNVFNSDDDDEDEEFDMEQMVSVEFGEEDTELYNFCELEWCSDLGGYWRVV